MPVVLRLVKARLARRAVVLAVALPVTGIAAAGCGHVPEDGASTGTTPVVSASGWRVIRGAPVRSVVVLVPGETFAPPPAWAKPKLNGVQAWDKSFLGRSNGAPHRIPAFISYQLGLLTVPPSVTDVLVWGYSSPPSTCPMPMGGPARTSPAAAPSPRGRCIDWTFINADNASNPEGTWQRLDTPAPSPSPPSVTVTALRSGGFVSSDTERFSPRRLEVQGPLSTIRWTFRAATCSIDLYWFSPPQLQRGPARAACPWRRTFSLSVVGSFASRGHVFSVIGGHVANRTRDDVRAVLADGRTWDYDARDTDGTWLFAVQRCGNFAGTALRSVQEINLKGALIARLPVPAAADLPGPASCSS